MYLPLIGLVTLAVIGAALAWRLVARPSPVGGGADVSTHARSWAATLIVLLVSATLARDASVRNGEYASAVTMARTVLARWPTPHAQLMVGEELAQSGQHVEAIVHLRAAARTLSPARYDFGSELVATGQLDEAIEQLQAFVHDEPQNLLTRSARFLMACAFEAKGQWPQAVEQIQLVLLRTPSDRDAHGLLADAFAGQQAFDAAIPHYRIFLTANPRDANAWTGLGVALITTGHGTDAIAAFRAATQADPQSNRFRQNLARALLDHDDVAEAAEQAQQAVTADPRDPAPHEILGRVWASQGRFDDARREFERSLQLDSSYAPAQEGLRSLPIKRLEGREEPCQGRGAAEHGGLLLAVHASAIEVGHRSRSPITTCHIDHTTAVVRLRVIGPQFYCVRVVGAVAPP